MSVVTEISKIRKHKYSLNPRGNLWSEDSSKFGQKMLEKMGWSRGKGLGPKENGITEHIRVRYKQDTQGMGFKETDGEWVEHGSKFNELLQSLSGEKNGENDIKITSLEEKSQSSKVRVHYKKFTRGKDLSRCSEKDLANIFGKKSLKATPTKPEEPEKKEKEENYPDSNFLQNSGSMVDYFKKKLPNFGKFGSPVVSNNSSNKDSESEGENYTGFGFGFKTPDKKRKLSEETMEGTPKKMKNEDEDFIGLSNPAFDPLFGNVEVRKHVLNTIEEESEEVEKNVRISEETENEISQDGVNIKKKKRNREEPCEEEVKKKKKKKNEVTDFVQDINCSLESRKKKKNKENCISAMDNPNFNDEDDESGFVDENYEVKRNKKKDDVSESAKKKKNEENCTTAMEESGFVDENYEVKRKKKKNKEAVNGTGQNFDDDSCQSSVLSENFEVKRKKKKKEENAMALTNPVLNGESIENSYANENFEVKRKKHKKNKQDMAMDNPNFNEENCEETTTFNNEFEVKRKKKKKKEKSSMAIDNPNFDDNYQNENSNINEDNVIDKESSVGSETKTKKKRKKESDDPAIDNSIQNLPIVDSESDRKNDEVLKEPSFDLMLNITLTPTAQTPNIDSKRSSTVKRRKSVRFSDVNEERIIPSKEDIKDAERRNELFEINTQVIQNGFKEANGNSNLAFNKSQVMLEEKIDEMSKKIDGLQAEIENDMNEAKIKVIGSVGNPDGENESLPDGVKLKYKYANFGKSPHWARGDSQSFAKKSYKHLIRGDIVLGFQNTNLHEIGGYGVNHANKS